MKTSTQSISIAEEEVCSICHEHQQVVLQSRLNNKANVCVRCLNVLNQSANIRPHNSIYCFTCDSYTEGIKIHYPKGESVDIIFHGVRGDPEALEAVYIPRLTGGKWNHYLRPNHFSCLTCRTIVPYWMAYSNEFLASWLPHLPSKT